MSGGGNTASYAYDALGRRKMRTVNGVSTVSVFDADNREVLEYDGATGVLQRWYAYGLGLNDAVGQTSLPNDARASFVPDIQGSIITMLNVGAGLTPFSYRPYGSSSTPASPFGFTGQRFDGESGLYYYRARHYSTAWGRFLQADPVGYSAGLNLYSYVANDPLNALDPFGLDTRLTIGLGGTAALQPLGLGGSYSVGVNVPDNPFDWRGYQVILGQVQVNAMVGVGGFLGFGLQMGYSQSTGSLPVLSGSVARYFEFSAGAGPSIGLGLQGTALPGSGSDYFTGGVTGGSGGVPGVRPSYGAGVWIAGGGTATGTLATPTFGQMYDFARSQLSGPSQMVSSASPSAGSAPAAPAGVASMPGTNDGSGAGYFPVGAK